MATNDNQDLITLVASADLSTKRYYAVKAHSVAEQMALAGDGENAIGVLQDKPVSGQAGAVAIGGKCLAMAGASFNPGVKVCVDGNGKFITAVSAKHVIGTSATAGVNNQPFELVIDKQGILV